MQSLEEAVQSGDVARFRALDVPDDAVRDRLRSRGPVVVAMSGGLDSTAVAATARALAAGGPEVRVALVDPAEGVLRIVPSQVSRSATKRSRSKFMFAPLSTAARRDAWTAACRACSASSERLGPSGPAGRRQRARHIAPMAGMSWITPGLTVKNPESAITCGCTDRACSSPLLPSVGNMPNAAASPPVSAGDFSGRAR